MLYKDKCDMSMNKYFAPAAIIPLQTYGKSYSCATKEAFLFLSCEFVLAFVLIPFNLLGDEWECEKERKKKEVLIEMQTELMECQMCHVYFNISFLKALQVSILVCLHMNEPFKRFLLNSAPVSENKAKEM